MNENDVPYRRLGYADVCWAVEIQPSEPDQATHLFVFLFEEYGCKSVEEGDPDAQPEVDFVMRATLGTWEEMIRNIQENQGPDLQHTLNYLTLPDDPIYIDACSPATARPSSSSSTAPFKYPPVSPDRLSLQPVFVLIEVISVLRREVQP